MATKTQEIYTCSNCGAQFLKWLGRCPECGKWGTIEKEQISPLISKQKKFEMPPTKVVSFTDIKAESLKRIKIGLEEFDRVLGGGIVPGSLILLGGEPGIGKSTLILQVAEKIKDKVLYISGEESAQQIKIRFDRLKLNSEKIAFLGETQIETICATIVDFLPSLAIIDSIQAVYSVQLPSEPGSISQVRVSTVKLMEVAKKTGIPIIIIGHVTKLGEVAGPKTLEHLVDTVCYLEGDQFRAFRILRTAKNRFGATSEIGVFDMQTQGLIEVKNPSQVFLQERKINLPGSVITATLEGTRIFLAEIQALVSPTNFGYPQRKALGFDFNRLNLLAAVLIKRANLNLTNQDIHLNITGGLKTDEPAVDLAVCLAIASAFKNKTIGPEFICFGEVGLGGEIRPVNQTEKRIKEAQKLGFKKIILPQTYHLPKSQCQLIQVKDLKQAVEVALI